jgi:hypothetical protein
MKHLKIAIAALALGFSLVAITAPADAFIRHKDVRAVKVVTKKLTDPIVEFFHILFRK